MTHTIKTSQFLIKLVLGASILPIALFFSYSQAAQAETAVFQNGNLPTRSYSGGRDTQIRLLSPNTNYAGYSSTISAIGGSGQRSILLKWDVSSIPANSVIKSARLIVNVQYSTTQSYGIYKLKRSWVTDSTTWLQYNTLDKWSTSGAKSIDDRDSAILGYVSAANKGVSRSSLNSSGVAVIQNWVTNPSSNMGLVIANDFNKEYVGFSSNKTATPAYRPGLEIVYTVPTTTPAPAISSFTASPSTIVAGQSATLSWSASNATTLTLNPGNVTVTGLTSKVVTPTATTTYTVTASNSQSSVSASTRVNVTPIPVVVVTPTPAPAISSFTASPSTIVAGQSATLSWSASNATTLTLNPGNVTVTGLTSKVVTPTANTSYALSAANTTGTTSASAAITVNPIVVSPNVTGVSRGYLTTPAELQEIKKKADQGLEPYKSSVNKLLSDINTATYWPFTGFAVTFNRDVWDGAATLLYAKALTYQIKGDPAYAEDVRTHLMELATLKPTDNGDDLGLVRHIPGIIAAADLIEGYPGWTATDKRALQDWLRSDKVYKPTDVVSHNRANNWGFMGSGAGAYIADYMGNSGLSLADRNGSQISARTAYDESNLKQFQRMNTGDGHMETSGTCPGMHGIYPSGRIPHETGRGTTGCDGESLLTNDSSWGYMISATNGLVRHAELLLRRGDRSMYDYITTEKRGSILAAIRYVVDNPTKSWDWDPGQIEILEPAYRYYRTPAIGTQLGVGTSNRTIASHLSGATSGPNGFLDFTTLTHGFATTENPSQPPVSLPPGNVLSATSGISSPTLFTTKLALGSTHPDVKRLQEKLKEKGYYNGPVTGYFGSITKAVLGALQMKAGIVANASSAGYGIFGPRTRSFLSGY